MTCVNINIWDELKADGSTYAYIDCDTDLSSVGGEGKALECVSSFLSNSRPEIATNVMFHDYSLDYPNVKSDSFKIRFLNRWEIILADVSSDIIDKLLIELNEAKLTIGRFELYFTCES